MTEFPSTNVAMSHRIWIEAIGVAGLVVEDQMPDRPLRQLNTYWFLLLDIHKYWGYQDKSQILYAYIFYGLSELFVPKG
jgi:hypothetical protein